MHATYLKTYLDHVIREFEIKIKSSEALAEIIIDILAAYTRGNMNRIKRVIDSYYALHSIRYKNTTCSQNVDKCLLCGADTRFYYDCTEVKCAECGGVLYFDDTRDDCSIKNKSGTFDPNRHLRNWWIHITGKESEVEITTEDDVTGSRLVELLVEKVRKHNKILQHITVYDMRRYLKELKRSNLNKNTTLLLRKVTGIKPPEVPQYISDKLEAVFAKVIAISATIKKGRRMNRNYYPFYIFKILDLIIPEHDHESRKILFYIYIQNKVTVEADDEDWKQICERLPELRYVPTDRTIGSKYFRK